MKSGPALRKVDSHRAIHDAAFQEAKQMTTMLENLRNAGRSEKSVEAAYLLIEQWETMTLEHAAAEEEGLYLDALAMEPKLTESVIQLKRDHELLRALIADIKTRLADTPEVTDDVMLRFYALLPVVEFHSRQEEQKLVHVIWHQDERLGS